VQLVRGVRHCSRARHGLFEHRAALHLAHVLAEVAHSDAAIDRDLPAVGLFLTDDQAKDRGFSRAVGADEADLLALEDAHRRFEKEDL